MHRIFPLVTISEPAARKLWTYTCAAQGEISGIGEVEWDDTSIRIADIMHFLPQKGSDASKYLDQGKSWKRLRFWFHTHGDMDAFFSYTDDSTIEKLSQRFPDLFVAGVFNKRGKTRWRIVLNGEEHDFEYRLPGEPPTEEELGEIRPEVNLIVKHMTWREKFFSFETDEWEPESLKKRKKKFHPRKKRESWKKWDPN